MYFSHKDKTLRKFDCGFYDGALCLDIVQYGEYQKKLRIRKLQITRKKGKYAEFKRYYLNLGRYNLYEFNLIVKHMMKKPKTRPLEISIETYKRLRSLSEEDYKYIEKYKNKIIWSLTNTLYKEVQSEISTVDSPAS